METAVAWGIERAQKGTSKAHLGMKKQEIAPQGFLQVLNSSSLKSTKKKNYGSENCFANS